ncbi:hypothetical protein MPF_0970 [Methanohalophilus portucalensis FDF-1]|uniref:Uncharacterized protein n=1 Tax=Methanohalophilus portucalensis FDF-1 TaxID=523843 RepID=A0A1L9C6M2_9EURY|nr:hypothetical protein MPF_0970 [Methanohalophilus portucalensis FDF-1]
MINSQEKTLTNVEQKIRWSDIDESYKKYFLRLKNEFL